MVFASWRKKSWARDEAMEYNGWNLWMTTVWLDENGNWQRCLKRIRRGWLDPRSKLNEKQSTIATHKAVVYCPIIDWKTKKKTGLNYKWDVCDALVASRPWNDCIQKSSIKIQSWLKSKWSRIQWHSNKKINVLVWTNGDKLDHPWWLTIQSLWGMGQLWKIMTSCIIQWESNGNKMETEHPAGVAPPCRPPPAGCSEFPPVAF